MFIILGENMKKLILTIPVILYLIINTGCQQNLKPAFGKEDEIIVLADSTVWNDYYDFLSPIFEKEIITPQPEQLFYLTRVDFSNFKKYQNRKNILIVTTLDKDNEVTNYVRSIIDSSALNLIKNGQEFVIKKKDVWAKNQVLVILVSNSIEELRIKAFKNKDEKHTYSKSYLLAMMTYALGGRAAELLIFNELTTGAGNDIERVTQIARKMVCEWGMSEKLGPVAYGSREEELFLGREITRHQEISEKTAQLIDEEIQNIVNSCMERAVKILRENIDTLHRLAKNLLEREILDNEEIDMIIRGEELPPVKKNSNGSKEEELPEHVKKLMEMRKGKNDGETDTPKTSDSGSSEGN